MRGERSWADQGCDCGAGPTGGVGIKRLLVIAALLGSAWCVGRMLGGVADGSLAAFDRKQTHAVGLWRDCEAAAADGRFDDVGRLSDELGALNTALRNPRVSEAP